MLLRKVVYQVLGSITGATDRERVIWMTTKFNPGDDVLILARVEEIAIGKADNGELIIRYNVNIRVNDDGGYMVWIDENTIVGNAF